jgi:alpha-beta hydrolase superfamily lysophospholipase
MPTHSKPQSDCYAIGWKTLAAYEHALRGLTRDPAPGLDFTSFARISAIDARHLPTVRHLPVDNGRLGYRCYDAGSDVSLILVHGSGGFGDQFHALANAVAQAGLACVYTVDMRGHGQSAGERGHAVEYPRQLLDDLAVFVRHVRNRHPAGRIILGGHSAGGGLVLGFARCEAASLVDGYVFFAPFVGLGSPTVRPHFGGWVQVHKAQLRETALANLLGIHKFNNRTVLDFNIEACLYDPRYVRSWSYNTMLAFGPGRWLPKAAPIAAACPVLLVAGDRDECFKPEAFPDALNIVAPHGELGIFEGAGHWDILADQRVIAQILKWLRTEVQTKVVLRQGFANNEAA